MIVGTYVDWALAALVILCLFITTRENRQLRARITVLESRREADPQRETTGLLARPRWR